MNNCSCNSDTTENGCGCSAGMKADSACPTCQKYGLKVSEVTIRSQVKKETLNSLQGDLDRFHFCTNPVCDTVYYDNKRKTIAQSEIKSKVTLKNDDESTPLCYCKKLLKRDFYDMLENKEPDIAKKIREIISEGKSFCEKSNPKGVCCTEDIKVFLARHGILWDDPSDKEKINQGCC